MPLKPEFEKLEEVPEPLRPFFKEVDRAGKKTHILDLEGDLPDEIAGPLKRARDHERKRGQDEVAKERVEREKERAAREAAEQKLEEALRGKNGDFDAYKKTADEAYKRRLDEAVAPVKQRLGKFESFIGSMLKAQAKAIAAEISTAPDLLVPHIVARLGIDEEGESLAIRVLDAEGHPSAFTVDEFKKELKADPRFAQVIVGSRATGGGAGGTPGGPGGGRRDFGKDFDPLKATPADVAAWAASRAAARKS